ncbi:MAG TPA: flavohemoglobin expression-modulating QEGLA motif protein [Luteibacter sp.]|jgi:uncharacterized protein (TIGR02421 family)|nr:flavohemoglobin expression-modulating QEGLA motif protein [Luteibacter sp.]
MATGTADEHEREAIRHAATLLHRAAKRIKVLKAIDWGPDVAERFFAAGARELPRPVYTPFDPAPTRDALAGLASVTIAQPTIAAWVARQGEAIDHAATMMANVGKPDFFTYGSKLYGAPKTPLRFFPQTPLDLAQSVREVTAQLGLLKVSLTPPRYFNAAEVADELRVAVTRHFGNDAPAVEIVDTLSANALASSTAIRLRRDARFTDCDAAQLLQHEAFIHVATSLNGRLQVDLPILGTAHPYDARTQEGLAVFAEIVSGAIEMDRLKRLADRVFAIQMAVDGADFIQVYRHFLEESDQPGQSFERARRVFRGGVITGGAPFAKDLVYLYGLLQVSNTFRALFSCGRSDCLPLLFCGKLDLSDIPALAQLSVLGLLRPPRFMPPWASDPRSLFALLTYSAFMNRMDVGSMLEGAQALLSETPPVEFGHAA